MQEVLDSILGGVLYALGGGAAVALCLFIAVSILRLITAPETLQEILADLRAIRERDPAAESCSRACSTPACGRWRFTGWWRIRCTCGACAPWRGCSTSWRASSPARTSTPARSSGEASSLTMRTAW